MEESWQRATRRATKMEMSKTMYINGDDTITTTVIRPRRQRTTEEHLEKNIWRKRCRQKASSSARGIWRCSVRQSWIVTSGVRRMLCLDGDKKAHNSVRSEECKTNAYIIHFVVLKAEIQITSKKFRDSNKVGVFSK